MTESRMTFEGVKGNVAVGERGSQRKNGGWNRKNLVEVEYGDIYFEVDTTDEDGLVTLALSAYHVENDENKKAYHCSLEIKLDRKQVQRLRGFLKYVLEHELPGDDA